MLQAILNEGFKHIWEHLVYQVFLYFFNAIGFLLGLDLQNSCLSQSYISSAIYFEPSQPTKTSIKPEDLPSLKILSSYVVKALYIPEVIGTELKKITNQKKRTLRLKSNYCCLTHNDWHVQTQALLPTLSLDIKWRTRLLWYSVRRNFVRWFNLATAI